MDYFRKNHVLYWTLEALAITLLLFLFTSLSYIFDPIRIFISVIFIPVIIAGFLFFLLKPIVEILKKKLNFPHVWAVITTFIFFLGVVALIIVNVFPQVYQQIYAMLVDIPTWGKEMRDFAEKVLESDWFQKVGFKLTIDDVQNTIINNIAENLRTILGSATDVLQTGMQVIIYIIMIPVILFYFLLDSHKFVPFISKNFFPKHTEEVEELFYNMNKTISNYIGGQFIEAFFVFVAIYIGYTIIHQPFALILALVAGVSNLIPYIGPFIGMVPSLLIAVTDRPEQIIAVILIVVVVGQIDGNLLYPNIIGRNLKIHPLTILFLLLAAGNIWGVLGMILVVPTYAVLRTVALFAIKAYKLNKADQIEETKKTQKSVKQTKSTKSTSKKAVVK